MQTIVIVMQDEIADLDLNWKQLHNISCENNSPWPSCLSLTTAFFTIAFMLIVMLIIVLGNLLVVLTVNNDHKLRTQRQNWLIVSLAVADLLVGLLVMPLTMTYEIIGVWVLGNVLCELWLALDVLFVTASILHICIISLDRYWSVTHPLTYPSRRTPQRISIMIGVAWTVSLLICLPPILGWHQPREPGLCTVSSDLGYVLYSSLGSFYIPVIILVIVYWRIYSITRHHNRQRIKETERTDKTLCQLAAISRPHSDNGKSSVVASQSIPLLETTLIKSGCDNQPLCENFAEKGNTIGSNTQVNHSANANGLSKMYGAYQQQRNMCGSNKDIQGNLKASMDNNKDVNGEKQTDKRKKLLKAKERQATLLLGLILTAFIASWLPFFVMYVLGAFGYEAPAIIFKFFFWLGYCNSGINPVIYTVFNREFKRALCRQLRKNQRYILSIREHFI